MNEENAGVGRIFRAAGHSIRGIKACWTHEAAFRQNSMLSAGLAMVSFFVAKNPQQWLLLIFPLLLLLIVELLNSAIENVVDRVGREHHELSGRAKDMGSAAVFICLTVIGLTWFVVIWHNFFRTK